MRAKPKIRATEGGWEATCPTCPWLAWSADLAAVHDHAAQHRCAEPDDVRITKMIPSGLWRVRCLRCTYVGAMVYRSGAVIAAWAHHRHHRRTQR